MTDATTLAVAPAQPTPQRCAVYTRVSVDDSKEGEFSSNLAQFEACHAFIASQHHKKWVPNAKLYDDRGYTGRHVQRPALQALLSDIEQGLVDVVVVQRLDLSRSRK